MPDVITPIAGAEHDIPPPSAEAAAALKDIDPLDPDALSSLAADEEDRITARELRSRALLIRVGAGPA